MVRRSLALGAVLAALLTAPAAAQLPTPDPALYVPDYAQMIAQDTFLRQSLGQSGGSAHAPKKPAKPRKKKAKPKPPPKPTAKQRNTLKFGSDPALSAEVNQFFLENFAAPGVAPETVIADLNRLREIGAADMKGLRWNARHLGDVAAYGLFVSYLVANQTTRASSKGVRLLRRAVGNELALDKAVRRRSDREQQRLAELVMLRVGYYVGWSNDLAAKGDPSGAEAVRRDLVRFARRVYGVDVSTVKLTAKGFTAKK